MPNINTTTFNSSQFILPNGRVLYLTVPQNWTSYAVSVRDVEDLTGYNFFTQLPQNIQDAIEQQTNTSFNLSCYLIADSTENNLLLPFVNVPIILQNFPIREGNSATGNAINIEISSTSQVNIFKTTFIISDNAFQTGTSHVDTTENSISQIDTTKVSPFKVGSIDTSFAKVSSFQVSSSEITVENNTSLQTSFGQISTLKDNFVQPPITEKYANQVSSNKVSFDKSTVLEVTSPQIDTTQVDSFLKRNINESSSSSLVTGKQFISSHLSHTNTSLNSTNTSKTANSSPPIHPAEPKSPSPPTVAT